MLNAKHVSRSGSLLGRAFLQHPTVTLVGAGFSKTPCCLPNFSMICVSLTWPDWRGELSSSAECKWLKIRTATWQAANRFRRRMPIKTVRRSRRYAKRLKSPAREAGYERRRVNSAFARTKSALPGAST